MREGACPVDICDYFLGIECPGTVVAPGHLLITQL